MYKTPTPEELREFLKEHGLSGSDAGRLTGVTGREVRRWTTIDGKNGRRVPWSAWSMLRLLAGAASLEAIRQEVEGTFQSPDNPESAILERPEPSPEGLKALLKEKGLTGVRAAEIVGVHQRTVYKWIRGERRIPVSAWKLLELYEGAKTNS